jgi:predicted transglutaminase-like cysteine proteinase
MPVFRSVRHVAQLALVAALFAAAALPAAAAPGLKSLFSKRGEPTLDLKPFPKWNEALEKYFAEKRKAEAGCTTKCPLKDWQALIKENAGQPKDRIMKNVNRDLNKMEYITDEINWGVKDYWESPGEFYAKFGDCEDYAISKYLTLRALGFSPDELLITAVQDLNLKVGHAILVVFMGGKAFLLDNQIRLITEDTRVKHYKPVYAVNEEAWWRFK